MENATCQVASLYGRHSRGARARTADLRVPNAARYQLRHTPEVFASIMPGAFTRQEMSSALHPHPLDPLLYHAHHLLRADDLPFWLALAAEFNGPILELGCGTGRILHPLARARHPITGLDHDPRMLAFLRRLLSNEGLSNWNVVQADMRTFALPARFNLVILPCNTYSAFPSSERRQIARAAHAHLNQGAIFAFSIPNPLILSHLEPEGAFELEDQFPHPQTGHPVQVFSSWQRSAETITFYWRYDQRLPTGETASYLTSTTHSLAPADLYLQELADASLLPIAQYGSYARTPYTPDSSYLIVLSRAA